MRYQRLGSTGLNVSELCLGAMTFGHKFGVIGTVGQDEANALVRTALDAGVNFFDTAEVYSLGESEEILGEALRTSGVDRTEVVVATKVSGRPPAELTRASANGVGQSRKHIREACDASLRRLGLDSTSTCTRRIATTPRRRWKRRSTHSTTSCVLARYSTWAARTSHLGTSPGRSGCSASTTGPTTSRSRLTTRSSVARLNSNCSPFAGKKV